MTSSYTLRPACEDDKWDVLSWRNAPEVRQTMLTQDVIDRDQHSSWWDRKQLDPRFRMMILEHAGTPLSVQIFFDIQPSTAWWAFYFTPYMPADLAPMMAHWSYAEIAGIGYGFEMLGLDEIYCEVLRSNSGVLRWHKRFGFTERPRAISPSEQHHDLEVFGMTAKGWAEMRHQNRAFMRWDEVAITAHPFDSAERAQP